MGGYSKCDVCNENTMDRSVINLGSLPMVLCLSLKRFRVIIPPPPIPTKDGKRKQAKAALPRLERSDHALTYRATLTLHCAPDSASPTDRIEVKYDLVAVFC